MCQPPAWRLREYLGRSSRAVKVPLRRRLIRHGQIDATALAGQVEPVVSKGGQGVELRRQLRPVTRSSPVIEPAATVAGRTDMVKVSPGIDGTDDDVAPAPDVGRQGLDEATRAAAARPRGHVGSRRRLAFISTPRSARRGLAGHDRRAEGSGQPARPGGGDGGPHPR